MQGKERREGGGGEGEKLMEMAMLDNDNKLIPWPIQRKCWFTEENYKQM